MTLCGACSSTHRGEDPTCPGVAQGKLRNASPQESYLGIGENERRALVEITDAEPRAASGFANRICSGVFISPEWVLTSQHCTQLVPAKVLVPETSAGPRATIDVIETRIHPTLDLALFRVDSAHGRLDSGPPNARQMVNWASLGITPLSLAVPGKTHLSQYPAVELAGYGVTETGSVGELRFLVERVVDSDSAQITVNGFGKSGACSGDSGGPLLVRADTGHVAVVGVLSVGSRSCLGSDHYLRVDAASVNDWLQEALAGYLPPPPGCGTISSEGRCLYGNALWCDDKTLRIDPCAPDRACGLSTQAGGFRCEGPSSPCPGLDSIGECRDHAAARCVDGRQLIETCSACAECHVDGATGTPYCE